MEIEIITQKLQLDIYGFGGKATNKDYAGTALKLSGKMWEMLKASGIKNKGKNIWTYNANDSVFAGVELEDDAIGVDKLGLEKSTIRMEKYAYYKHVGPYNLIKEVGQNMRGELTKQGYEITLPYIEIYGHWMSDETKSETELFMCLK